MPTATEYFGYTITNIGALTTPFTAPASCTTGTDYYAYALEQDWASSIIAGTACDPVSLKDCFPSGEAWDDLAKTDYRVPGQGHIAYFSPASECPSGWTTAGVYESATSSGIFASDLRPYDDKPGQYVAAGLLNPDIFTRVMSPEETLIFCCPRYI